MEREMTISRRWARFAVQLRQEELPAEVLRTAKRFLYDSVGCALGSLSTPDVRALWTMYRHLGGREEATVIGFGDQLPAIHVTLINSLMVRALDYNDIYWKEDPSHPSDLIPAALAVGEREDASMQEVLKAVVLAYELEQRLCECARPGLRERKWHHATLTQFVSPVVAGYLLGLDEDQLVNAIGINGCHNHTIGCPTAGVLTMMKNTVDPLAVQAGVQAALMAQLGFTGTAAVFEGKEGLMDVYGPDWDPAVLTADLGASWRIQDCSMKAFPTEALTHTHISATLKLVREQDIQPDDVEEVRVTTIARACDILFDPHKYEPRSRETADHSLPFCIARAILDRQITRRSFARENIEDPRLRTLIHKIKGEASQEFEQLFPDKQPSRVTIRLRGGEEYSVYLDYPKGDPREPMTEEDLDLKFRGLAGDLLSTEECENIKDIIMGCDDLTARDFMEQLTVDTDEN